MKFACPAKKLLRMRLYWCSKWQHIKCANVSKSHYDMLNTCPDQIVFFCSICIAKLPKVLEKSTDGEDHQCPVGKQIETLQSQMSDLVDRFQQFENKINSNSRSQSLPSHCKPLVELFQLHKLSKNTRTEKAVN